MDRICSLQGLGERNQFYNAETREWIAILLAKCDLRPSQDLKSPSNVYGCEIEVRQKKRQNTYFFLWKKYEKHMNGIFGDL